MVDIRRRLRERRFFFVQLLEHFFILPRFAVQHAKMCTEARWQLLIAAASLLALFFQLGNLRLDGLTLQIRILLRWKRALCIKLGRLRTPCKSKHG